MAQQGDHVSCNKRIATVHFLPYLSFVDNDNIHGKDEGKVLGNWNRFMMIIIIIIIMRKNILILIKSLYADHGAKYQNPIIILIL